jgi:hypothetical protein
MTNTNTTYIPKIQDWVDYYGKQTSQVNHSDVSAHSTVADKVCSEVASDQVHSLQGVSSVKSTSISGDNRQEMSPGIQVVSPVQTAVNQAMATKRRRRRGGAAKKKGRRKKVGQRKRTKVSGKRRRGRKKTKRKTKVQRDIFNY